MKEFHFDGRLHFLNESETIKVPFKRKTLGLRPKSHVVLKEIKIEERYLKRNSQTLQGKNRENINRYGNIEIIKIEFNF